MARFDVFETAGGALVLDCQTDILSHLKTRFAVPLFRADGEVIAAKRLNPIFAINGKDYIMYSQFASAIPSKDMKKFMCSLTDEADTIIYALDMLISGY